MRLSELIQSHDQKVSYVHRNHVNLYSQPMESTLNLSYQPISFGHSQVSDEQFIKLIPTVNRRKKKSEKHVFFKCYLFYVLKLIALVDSK